MSGAKPADMPVMRPTRFSLMVNLRTARALGIRVAQYIQQGADEVLE